MKRPTFAQGTVVAAALAFSVSVVIAALTPFIGFSSVIRLVVPLVWLAYLGYLLRSSHERIGRVTTLSMWSLLAIATWWFAPSLYLYVLIHIAAIWLVRCLYFYAGIFPAALDLLLTAFSVCACAWAISRTGSEFIATWCLFFVQAFFVAIPKSIGKGRSTPQAADNAAFERARRQADAALRQLIHQ
jgi:hypothetical protein